MKTVTLVVNSLKFLKSHRLELINAIAEHYKVHLITQIDTSLDGLSSKINLHDTNFNRGQEGILSEIKLFISLVKKIRQIKPDIIHTVTIKPLLYGAISSLFLSKVRNVFAISGLGLMFNSDKLVHKLVRGLVGSCLSFVEKRRKCVFIFQNENDKQLLEDAVGRPLVSVMTFGSGVNLEKYSCKSDKFNSISVLFAGRLLIDKGIVHFLELAKSFANKDLKFYIAGEVDKGNPNAIQPELLNSYCSSDIQYLGYINDMPKLLSEKSIFVYPSYYGEGIPKVLLEAIASGMPIITTDHPGCRDAVRQSFAYLCNPDSLESLKESFSKLMEDNSKLPGMSNEAKRFASKNFSVEQVIKIHLGVYRGL